MAKVIRYIPGIDGLRALAVLAVVIFHLNPAWLPGGFLGVDVFFVISGFLICSIVFNQTSKGTFSMISFWRRRIRRLYPALLVMVAFTLVAGNFILIKPERNNLLLQSLSSVFSYSNLWLWRTTGGYWDSSSGNIALLHTWSLSLEEQFYIVFAIFMGIFSKLQKKRLFQFLMAIGIASFLLCIAVTVIHPRSAFYMLPTRMWELAIGCLLAIRVHNNPQPVTSIKRAALYRYAGLSLVFGSFFFIKESEHFPGVYPMIPGIGTALVIFSLIGFEKTRSFLCLRPVRYIGKISYSLYLWHWPVLVFSGFIFVNWTTGPILIALFIMGIMSTLSYHYVETPLRKEGGKRELAAPVLLASVIAALLPLIYMPVNPVFKQSPLAPIENSITFDSGHSYEATKAITSGKGGIAVGELNADYTLALVGSSHARMFSKPFEAFVEEAGIHGVVMGTSGVGITTAPFPQRPNADVINNKRNKALAELKPRITILAGRWELEANANNDFFNILIDRIAKLENSSDVVLVLSQVPMVSLPDRFRGSLRKYLVARERSSLDPFDVTASAFVKEVNGKIKALVEDLHDKRIIFVDLDDTLLTEGDHIRLMSNGQFIYSNSDHLNNAGAEIVFQEAIAPLLEQRMSKK